MTPSNVIKILLILLSDFFPIQKNPKTLNLSSRQIYIVRTVLVGNKPSVEPSKYNLQFI